MSVMIQSGLIQPIGVIVKGAPGAELDDHAASRWNGCGAQFARKNRLQTSLYWKAVTGFVRRNQQRMRRQEHMHVRRIRKGNAQGNGNRWKRCLRRKIQS